MSARHSVPELCCQSLPMYPHSAGIAEAHSDIRDLLHAPCGSGAAAEDRMVSSSDEDTSDEAFAGRHALLEAEEQQRFNTLAGKSQSLFIGCECCC